MADLIKPWQDRHFGRQHKILECRVTGVGKDAAGIHTLTVDVLENNQHLPYKVVTRTDHLPLGMPLGSVLPSHILEVRFSTIDESGRFPALTPVKIFNKTHEGGDIFHFETGKLYDSAARTKTFNPWEDYLKDMEELNKEGVGLGAG